MLVEGLNPEVSHEMWLDMQAEAAVSQEMGVPWQMRGPPADLADPSARWRGQRYRPETGKWANRGGENRDYYRGYYKGVAEGTQAKAAATRLGTLDAFTERVGKMTTKGSDIHGAYMKEAAGAHARAMEGKGPSQVLLR